MFSITIFIIIITVLASISAFRSDKVMNDLIFYPPAVTYARQYYRFISCGFIHADSLHLIFNMIALYAFGEHVERGFQMIFGSSGKWLYLLMYLMALVVCLLPTYFKNKDNSAYRSLGASGAVAAVIFAGILMHPGIGIGLIFLPGIYIPGFIFGPLYLLISYYLDRKGGGNINHSAHIWGALFGLAFLIVAGKLIADFDAIDSLILGIQAYLAG